MTLNILDTLGASQHMHTHFYYSQHFSEQKTFILRAFKLYSCSTTVNSCAVFMQEVIAVFHKNCTWVAIFNNILMIQNS